MSEKKDSRVGPDRFCRFFADFFGLIRSDRILFGPKQSNSLIFNSIRSNLIFFDLFRFYLLLFDFIQSNSVLLDLLLHTRARCVIELFVRIFFPQKCIFVEINILMSQYCMHIYLYIFFLFPI